MRNIFVFISLLTSIFISCQINQVFESCLDGLIDKELKVVLNDTTIQLMNVLDDSTDYRFIFKESSFYFKVFWDNGIIGSPTMDIKVQDQIINSVQFVFVNIGDVDPNLEVVATILKDYLCIENELIPNKDNRLSYCTYVDEGIVVDVTVHWDAHKMDIIKVNYTKRHN